MTSELVAKYERPFIGVAGRPAYLRAARSLRSEDHLSRADAIEHLDIPVLVVWGSARLIPAAALWQKAEGRLHNLRLEVIVYAGHFLPEDVPDKLGRVFAEFAKI